MKKKIVPIVLTALMLSLTACGTNSNDTVQNVSQGKLATEVVEQNVSEVEDTKESKEALSSEGKTIREDTSKESKADAEHLTNKKTESDDKEAKSEDKETVSNDKVESTTEETTANTDSDKTETTTETPISNETASVQSQTFNVNITASNPVVTDNGLVYETIDFGNFEVVINGNAHVASELSGWAVKNWDDDSYDCYILVPLDTQDTNKVYDFEIRCSDKVKSATISACEGSSFVLNNGSMVGTASAVSGQVTDGTSICIGFNVKF